MELKYIDISTHQKNVDYAKVKADGVQGVILRAGFTGYGSSKSKRKDEMFEKHYAGFTAVGIPIGVYYYSCAYSPEEAIIEAMKTLEIIKGKNIQLPVWFDTEDSHDVNEEGLATVNQRTIGKVKLTETALAFLETIKKAGYVAGIYASTSWLNNQLDMSQLKEFDVWVAHYKAARPTYKGAYTMWQYASDGSVDGIAGNVDMNICYKDYLSNQPEAPKPIDPKPTIPSAAIKVGDVVNLFGVRYATGQKIPTWVKLRKHTVAQLKDDRALLKEITSWVFIKDIKKV